MFNYYLLRNINCTLRVTFTKLKLGRYIFQVKGEGGSIQRCIIVMCTLTYKMNAT